MSSTKVLGYLLKASLLTRLRPAVKTPVQSLAAFTRRLPSHLVRNRHLEQEMSVVYEVGRIVTSTLDIQQVYDEFATQEAKQIALVRSTWAKLIPMADAAAKIFYTRLFEIDPSLRSLFKGDMATQGKLLMGMINTAVEGLDDLDSIVPAVQELGRNHAGYGVKSEDYKAVASALLWTLRQGLGSDFNADVKNAWVETYTLLATVMQEAAAEASQESGEDQESGGADEATQEQEPALQE